MAALAWVNLFLASWLTGTSMSLTHRRVDVIMWPAPRARPARAMMVPPPTNAALVIRVAVRNRGPPLPISLLLMAPILSRDLIITVLIPGDPRITHLG